MVNDVILPSGCEAPEINLGNKNMKIGIFTRATSVRSKNIFTDISRYPTGKHEIIIFSHFVPLIRKSLMVKEIPESIDGYTDSYDVTEKNMEMMFISYNQF